MGNDILPAICNDISKNIHQLNMCIYLKPKYVNICRYLV